MVGTCGTSLLSSSAVVNNIIIINSSSRKRGNSLKIVNKINLIKVVNKNIAIGSIFFFSTIQNSWSLGYNTFKSDNPIFSFEYSDDLIISPKLVKTHDKEIFLKSELYKGFNVGITIDPVKINNIKEFTTPEGLANKVVEVEKSKDGVFDTQIISAVDSIVPYVQTLEQSVDSITSYNRISNGNNAYDLEYKVDSSRGLNHYNVRTTILNKKLYVFTVQCKEETFNELQSNTKEILNSLLIGI